MPNPGEPSTSKQTTATAITANNANADELKHVNAGELKRLVLSRGQAKGTITRILKFATAMDSKMNSNNEEDFSDMENKYCIALAALEEQISKVNRSTSVDRDVTFTCQHEGQEKGFNKLPPISLNKFDGEVSAYNDFISLFKSVIDGSQKLSQCEKFYYLKSLLVGEPADLIKHLSLTAESYTTGLKLLDERYNNKNRVINMHINALLDLKQMHKYTAPASRELVSKTKQHVAALKNLSVPAKHWDLIIIAILQRKIDQYTLKCYHLELKDDEPNLENFLKFLDQRASALESVAEGGQAQPASSVSSRRTSLVTTTSKPIKSKVTTTLLCGFCKGKSHRLYQCEQFKLASLSDRLSYVTKNELCQLCLNKHNNKCRLLFKCTVCKQKHNSLLHQDEASLASAPSIPQPPKVSSLSMSKSDNVLLPTIKVRLHDAAGNEVQVRALCDTGSQISLLLSDVAKKINCKLYKDDTSFVGVCDSANMVKQKAEVQIYSTTNNNHMKVTCCVVDKITCDLPQFQINRNKLNIPSHIPLADPEFYKSEAIGMLLGCDIFFEMLLREQLPVVPAGLYLHNTTFGYVVAGMVPAESSIRQPQATELCNQVCAHVSVPLNENKSTKGVENIMKQFWKCENVPETFREATTEQELAEKIFTESVVLDNCRFQVDLPLKQGLAELNMGDSLSRALSRFHNLERRFAKDPHLFQQYKAFIHEYLSLGHGKYVDIETYDLQGGKAYFLPHHPVYNENSKTTKLRVVFDGSMNTSLNFSLNDMLLNGPCIQNELFNILILFRLHKYILIADVQKLFRQTNLNPEHCPLQNILWRDSPTEAVKCIQLQTISYGLKSSTFLSTRCLDELTRRYGEQYPLAANVLKNNTYVDDINTGHNDLNVLLETRNQLTALLKLGGFNLHKWCANEESLLEGIPKELHNLADIDFCHDENAFVKTLGVTYKLQSDTLNISSPKQLACDGDKYTKRQVLSFIGRFFDPLGLVGPITVAAKIIMQKIWQSQVAWDSELPVELVKEFKGFVDSLNKMNTISFNRNINTNDIASLELIGYCDSSSRAYGCCLYLRTIDRSGNVDVNLLCSKSRINPMNPVLSTPRLELNSALLLGTLVHKVQEQISKLGFLFDVHLHSDSKVVLAWLDTEPAKLSVYVANRVKQINNFTKNASWSYVNTTDNPADCLSRGVEPHMLHDKMLWFHGPQCLMDSEHKFRKEFDPPSDLPEIKTCNVVSAPRQPFDLLSRYSFIHKLKRVVGYIYRFFNNCRAKAADRISRVALYYEELNSVVIQIEGILNSRPLLALETMDPDDMSYLTPAHFLTACSLSSYPEPDITDVPINRLSFWKQCTKMMQCFWKDWSRQYLVQLQNRPKWHKNVPNIEKGTLVLLRLANAPPLVWQTARVIETFPGSDGKVRALTVKTSKGSIVRTSVTKVCVLPIDDDN